jgi:hypothetical protein
MRCEVYKRGHDIRRPGTFKRCGRWRIIELKRVVEMPGFWILGITLLIAMATLALFLISWGCAALGVGIEAFLERRREVHWVHPAHMHLHRRSHLPPGIQLM